MPTATVRRGLYAIVDVDALARHDRPVLPFAEHILAAGPIAAMQLRAKSLGARATLDLAGAMARLCERANVPFFVNDRPDVAVLAGAFGVHVGTGDLPVREVRRFAPGLAVGTSTHGDEDVSDALASEADYVAFGPVFVTGSKPDHAPVTGLEALRAMAARCARAGRPVVAIGGITLERAPSVRAAGATAGAVISGLLVDEGRVTDNARALHVALGGA
jgi:thiamine-phosphate pyrophosphorylase